MLRGFNVAYTSLIDDVYGNEILQEAKNFGANIARVGIDHLPSGLPFTEAWPGVLANIEAYLQRARAANISVIICCTRTPYDNFINSSEQWADPVLLANLITVWTDVATLSQGYLDVVYGYDLLNEPIVAVATWMNIAVQIIDEIRLIDEVTYIVYEESNGGQYLTTPLPGDQTKIIYSFHFYTNLEFTHQGIYSFPFPVSYPNVDRSCFINDKNFLYNNLLVNKRFARDNNAKIYVGEFSVVRHADTESQLYWFKVALDYFEKHEWSYTYHALKEWKGWDLDYESLPGSTNLYKVTGRDTAAGTLLKSYLARNNT